MANVRTLQDINSKGHRLGSIREQELEKSLDLTIRYISELNDCNEQLQSKCVKQTKDFNQERKQWDKEKKQWGRGIKLVNDENQKQRAHNLEIINEAKRLKIENITLISRDGRNQESLIDYSNKLQIKSKEVTSLKSTIKSLKKKLESAQENSSLKVSEIETLKTKLSEVEGLLSTKESEFENLKTKLSKLEVELVSKESVIHSLESKLSSEAIKIGGETDDIFAVNKPIINISKYLRKKSMDQTEEIDIPQSSDTINKANNETKPQILDSSRSINMKSSTSNADISQIVETKDFSEEAISKTDFIGNDQSYATKTKMAEILPIGALGVCETLVNDKYRIPPIVKLVILIIIAILIIRFVHKLIIWNKEKSTKSKSENGSDRSKISGRRYIY
ncbi:7807_t:CDS:1 [Entrophospora sp. SA101]|nr:7807_t:CDS:1 [Entrophospora sp. SA101]